METKSNRKLHRGRQNVTIWMKPEHVDRLDELANGQDRSAFMLYLVSNGLDHLHEWYLASLILKDIINRKPGTRNDLIR